VLQPRTIKRRKWHRGRRKGVATRTNTVHFGQYGLVALEPGWLTGGENGQLEAARIAVMRFVEREAPLWIRVYPHKPVTKKAAETRMGGGKGDPEGYVAVVKRGTVIFEMDGLDEKEARIALRKAQAKLPIRTRFVRREDLEPEGASDSDA